MAELEAAAPAEAQAQETATQHQNETAELKATASTNMVKLVVEAKEEEIPQDKKKDIEVVVQVVAPGMEARAPIDLVMLLDISGSMAWQSSQPGHTRLNLLMAAAQFIINKLAPHDRLAIVPFHGRVVGSTGLVYMTPQNHPLAVGKVLGLRPGGDTKFFPALQQAAQLLQGRGVDDNLRRPGFVFLLSDGEDKTVLNKQLNNRYPVHTFSICERCNPQSMHYVAYKTRGTFHVVKDKLSDIGQAVGVFIGGATSVVAVDTRIHLNTVDDGVVITGIKADNYSAPIAPDKKSGQIVVGVLYAKQVKSFIVCLNVPETNKTETKLLSVTGGYFPPVDRTRQTIPAITVEVKRTGTGGKPSPTPTFSVICMVEIVRIEVVSIVQTLVKKYDNDTDTDVEPDHQAISKDLRAKWNECKGKHGAVRQQVLEHQLVVTLGMEIDILVEHAEQGLGHFYMLSWLTAHATQHATSLISPKPTTKQAVVSYFQTHVMQQVATEAVFHISGYSKLPDGGSDPCKCVDFDKIDKRLELWSEVRSKVPQMFEEVHDAETRHLTAVFREASLDAINRAMHHDMYLALVHASNIRKCYCAEKQQKALTSSEHEQHGGCGCGSAKPKGTCECGGHGHE